MAAIQPRSIPVLLRWLLPLAMVLACAQHATEAPPSPGPSRAANAAEPGATEAARVSEPVKPNELATPSKPDEAAAPAEPAAPSDEAGERPEPTDAERIDAYVASCSHRFTAAPDEWSEEGNPETPVDECEHYEWDQNCSYDPSGCWNEGQECIRSCGKPCTTCQDECASGCDQCKAACAPGATECIRKCAESRLACRSKCIESRTRCQSDDCPKQEKACYASFEDKRKKKCPQCAKISSCLQQDHGDEDYDKACARKFPKANKVCFDWCMEYYEDEGGE